MCSYIFKEGLLSVEEAMEQAKNLGVMASTEPVGDENSEEKIFNFGVYKYGRDKTSLSRRILQVHLLTLTPVHMHVGWISLRNY